MPHRPPGSVEPAAPLPSRRRRRRPLRTTLLTAGLTAALGWSAAVPGAAAPPPAYDASSEGSRAQAVLFEDHFDGSAGSAVDGTKWNIETGDNVNNHERQWYTPGNANAALDGSGNLVITARKENPGNYQC